MLMGRKLAVAASTALLLLAVRAAFAAPNSSDDKEKERVLRRLDEAAKNFHSTAADFQFDSVETDPIPDKDVQSGVVYYERTGKSFRMAAHIRAENKKPIDKVYVFSGGVFKLFEGGNLNQVTTYAQASLARGVKGLFDAAVGTRQVGISVEDEEGVAQKR